MQTSRLIRLLTGLLPALLILGCGKPEVESAAAPPLKAERSFEAPGSDPWVLTWTNPRTEANALLWNGLVGVRLGPTATGTTLNGEPLPYFDIKEYEPEGEEKVRQLPNPLLINWTIGGVPFNASSPDYRQTLDMKAGVITTEWTQDGGSCGETSVRVRTFMTKTMPGVLDEWEIQPSQECRISYEAPVDSEQGEYFRFTWYATDTLAERQWSGDASPSKPARLRRIMLTGLFGGLAAISYPDFEEAVALNQKEWSERWQTDIEIDGPVEDQQAIRSWMFYLRSAMNELGDMSISPMGLSSAQYNGHVFWDADVWVFPALAFIDPEAAKEIPEYRLATLPQARKNFSQWMRDGRPVGNGRKLGAFPPTGEYAGAMYPWESSVSGNETVTGPSRFQHHITGTVAFQISRASVLGLVQDRSERSVMDGARVFYDFRHERTANGSDPVVEVKDTMSPDEFHTGDNDLYTNLLAQWLTQGGAWVGAQTKPQPIYKLPKDDKTFLTYDNDPVRSYKQAAAVLAIYPLQYPPAEAQAQEMMERFADKVTENGPAMTDSVHALIWARLGETDKAYETWQKSWKDFAYPPHLLFSEKRRSEKTYFTTGAGGCLQTVIYGFLGFRIDSQKLPGAAWTTQLKGGNWLSIKPNLPKAWKKVTFRNFKVLGKSYTLTATHDSVEVTEGA